MAWRGSHQQIFIYLLFSPLSFFQRLLQGLQFNDGQLYHGPGPSVVLFRLLLCGIQLRLDRHEILLCFLLQLLQIVSGFSQVFDGFGLLQSFNLRSQENQDHFPRSSLGDLDTKITRTSMEHT